MDRREVRIVGSSRKWRAAVRVGRRLRRSPVKWRHWKTRPEKALIGVGDHPECKPGTPDMTKRNDAADQNREDR